MTPIATNAKSLYMLALISFCCTLLLVGCGQQQQSQQPDPRLKVFHVLSAHIVILDSQAEVDGTIQNTGTMRFPFDVSMIATFYDSAGNVVGQAQGTAEDVYPGMTRSFILTGQVDSAKYSRMTVTPVSLRERRQEQNLPTPPPVVP
ncbi:MAG TPA: FxLYD domain-containing protein [Ktedonobacteraceae bacterium]|nr:FxLYD domain-containing protein [Ktedonobacteraceae bacterium]